MPKTSGPCSQSDCTREKRCDNLCSMHYARRKKGQAMDAPTIPPRGSSLREKVEFYTGEPDENGCWPWTGPTFSSGYGRTRGEGHVHWRAHRAAWMLSGRELDDDLTIDHLCRNILCVNVDHMEQVTRAENARRARRDNPTSRPRMLTDDQARTILTEKGRYEDLGEKYGVSRSLISEIKNGRAYTHVR